MAIYGRRLQEIRAAQRAYRNLDNAKNIARLIHDAAVSQERPVPQKRMMLISQHSRQAMKRHLSGCAKNWIWTVFHRQGGGRYARAGPSFFRICPGETPFSWMTKRDWTEGLREWKSDFGRFCLDKGRFLSIEIKRPRSILHIGG